MQDILDPSSSEEEDYPSPDSASTPSTNHDGFLFNFYSLSHSLRTHHPPPDKVPSFWDYYEQNVCPLVTVIHRPTAKNLLIQAAQNVDSLDKNSEAMVFAIYLVTTISMTQDQCLSLLGETQDAMVKRFRFATEQALAKANFLNTQSSMLLQAAVLFLIGVRREDDTKFVWSMTALVLRLAQGLGLHRDGTKFGLKPFETEMRRRLWWHIGLLDIRSSEDHGTDSQIHPKMYDTKLPLNVNDEEIYPEMTDPPKEHVGFTDMTFTLVRLEITTALRGVSYGCPNGRYRIDDSSSSISDGCGRMIQAINQRIEERYIRHCDTSIPIHWVCATVARLILAKVWLTAHHPMARNGSKNDLTMAGSEKDLTSASRESLFLTSIEVLEFALLMLNHPKTVNWGWLSFTHMPWQCMAFVLAEVCVRPIDPTTDRAWAAVSEVYGDWEKGSKHKKGQYKSVTPYLGPYYHRLSFCLPLGLTNK